MVQLNDAYVLCVPTEALTAHLQPVFVDQTVAVRVRALARLPCVTPSCLQPPNEEKGSSLFHSFPRAASTPEGLDVKRAGKVGVGWGGVDIASLKASGPSLGADIF